MKRSRKSMSRHTCVSTFLLVLVVLVPTLLAQGDPARLVQAQRQESIQLASSWLESEDPRTRAWAAFLVGRDELVALLPRLRALVQKSITATAPLGNEEREATRAAIDAILRLNGSVPPDEAAAIYAQFPAASLILLSRALDTGPASRTKETSDVLLKIFREETRGFAGWLTAGNLLAERRIPGFAAAVLKETTIVVDVRVIVPGGISGPPGGIAGSCLGGARSGDTHPDWPAVGNYYVSDRGTLLSRGTYPTFYTRVVGPPEPEASGPDLRCAFGSWVSRDNLRPAFLTRLAGVSADRLNAVERRTVTWRTDAQYLQDLRAVVAAQRTLIAELVGRLVKNGALTEEERLAAQPTILVQVLDARGGVKRRPLPLPGGDGKLVRYEAKVSD